MSLSPESIRTAHNRIAPYIHRTPLLESSQLNEMLGHQVIFKVEGFQKTGSFKVRGALNAMLTLQERDELPDHIVAYSSGNHAQGVAFAAKMLAVQATIFIPAYAQATKIEAARSYGAEVVVCDTRAEAEARSAELVTQGAVFISPFDNDDVIAGQGTSCLEALQHGVQPNAIFATVGGGGWSSGSYLAKELLCPSAKMFAAEPLAANDAARSVASGEIVKFNSTPETIADGAATPAVGARTFPFIQKMDGVLEVAENDIIYWTQWLMHLLKITVEPTSAVSMGAAAQWLATQTTPQTALVLLSGGNVAPSTHRKIWAESLLSETPSL